MISPAFRKAERTRLTNLRASKPQRDTVIRLAKELGMEPPDIHWASDADDVIDRLKAIRTQPVLQGFSASTGGATRG